MDGLTGALLRSAVTEQVAGDELAVVATLGEVDPNDLDDVVKVYAALTETARELRRARDARAEKQARAEAASKR